MNFPPLPATYLREIPMTEERKYAILFAATLLCARKLNQLDFGQRKFDLLLFWALDRLSREGALKTLQHLDRLESYGVAYRSFTEPYFDSCGIFKEAVVSIVATLAKQERIRRSERTKAGLARVRASGKRLGPPRRLNGHTAAIVSLRSQGISGREIARRLSISEGSVRRLSAAA